MLGLGVVAIHNVCGMMLGFLAAIIFHVEYSRTTAIAIEVGMQNSGLAVSLAAANFAANPLATLPGAIFSVWHNIAGSIFAGIRRAGAENLAELDRIREIDCCNCEKQQAVNADCGCPPDGEQQSCVRMSVKKDPGEFER